MSYQKTRRVRPTGTAWTFADLELAADDPDPRAERVQAVLYPDPARGFRLLARQGTALHPVTHRGKPIRFRTIEAALNTLADVPYLHDEIALNAATWSEVSGPL